MDDLLKSTALMLELSHSADRENDEARGKTASMDHS